MSACIFFASDAPLPEVFPLPEYDYLAINVDDGTIDDGGADDNFALRTYPDSFLYTCSRSVPSFTALLCDSMNSS